MSYTHLLVGCGNNRTKRIKHGEVPQEFTNLTTLDIDPSCNPDVVWDMNVMPYPFGDNEFDEIHAYETLEHQGTQGDFKFFFAQFYEFWRMLKPGGLLCITVPAWNSPWSFGDPGHTRVLPKECFAFLTREMYDQVGKTAATDYRQWWKGDFSVPALHEGEHVLGIVLKAIK